jgi:hypothetical protein
LVYVYYNLRPSVKQHEKEPDIEAISLDVIDTTSQWRVEIEKPEMEEEEHADDLGEETPAEEGEEEEEEDVPFLVDTEVEEETDLLMQPMSPPPPRRVGLAVRLGSIGTGRRKLTFPSTTSSSPSTSAGEVGASIPSSSRVPPRPPIASRGRVVPFTRKRGRGNR